MDIYLVYLHIICAFLSLGLLIVRGGMQLTQRNWRAVKLLKILPHLTDTLFSKKQSQNRPHFFFLALAALVATILIGYFH